LIGEDLEVRIASARRDATFSVTMGR
jgi:hypothetical protein